MFETIGREHQPLERSRRALVVAGLVGGALFFAGGRHYFISAFFLGMCVMVFRTAPWLLAAACLEVGVGAGLTPHRPEFAGWGDIFNIGALSLGLLVLTITLLCIKRTRRKGAWLLLGLLLIPASCSGTYVLRRAAQDTSLP